MESYGAAMVIVWILGIILAIMALLMPVYVYQIRNRCLNMDKKMATIIELLGNDARPPRLSDQAHDGGQGGKIKTCPFCGTKHRLADITCTNCGKAIGL